MAIIRLETRINAPPERCFDLSLDVDLHQDSLGHTGERAVAGRTSGVLGPGEEVTWEGRHFGLLQRHTSRITAYDRPVHFRDPMVKGRFARFEHDHYFEQVDAGTLMRDVLAFASPMGILGRAVDRLVLGRYVGNLLRRRNEALKRRAEAK